MLVSYRNLFGKWCRPNYNSAVATFCNNVALDLPITVNDRATELELLYIDDLVEQMISCLLGKEKHCDYEWLNPIEKVAGRYCFCPVTHKVTLGEIVDLLGEFSNQTATLIMPGIAKNSFFIVKVPFFLHIFICA